MGFVKGAMIGMVAGTIVGMINSDSLYYALNMGKKQVKRMKRRYGL
ncbi:MAG: hypothetical protein N2749_00630 [Clostridia bacterium]|nr:hypothetical protein [Clostridia bacterium]